MPALSTSTLGSNPIPNVVLFQILVSDVLTQLPPSAEVYATGAQSPNVPRGTRRTVMEWDADERLSATDPRFTIIGSTGRDIDMGYEHALGISALLSRVRTRFLLIQDPDCFIVMPDWVLRVPQYMMEHDAPGVVVALTAGTDFLRLTRAWARHAGRTVAHLVA